MTIRRRLGDILGRPGYWRTEFYERIGATPNSACLPLIRTAADIDGRDWNGAVYDLGRHRYLRAIPMLIRLARELDAAWGKGAMRRVGPVCDALGMMDDPRAHAELVRLYEESQNTWTRADAIDAMGYEKRVVEPWRILQALSLDEEPPVRCHAMWAIVEQVDWNEFAPYEAAAIAGLRDPEPLVRGLAADALSRKGRAEFKDLIRPLLDDHESCRYLNAKVSRLAEKALEVLEDSAE